MIFEAAATVSTLPPDIFLVEKHGQFYLFSANKLDKHDSGYRGGIIIKRAWEDDGWYVDYVWAEHGYGPLLYRIAMEYATQNGAGLKPSPDGSSEEAGRVWDRFDQSANVGFNKNYRTTDTDELSKLRARSQQMLAKVDVHKLLVNGFDNTTEGASEAWRITR